ncbi:ATP-binding protein [Candidatus Micrarchaeota archaeon]|nr:ATP-binding protein [Candidatus Micrarchaeota archaeon]
MQDFEILQVLADTNFWKHELDAGMPRASQLSVLERLSKIGEITVVKGVRRSGKSTLLLHFLKRLISSGVRREDTLIVNLEDPRLKNLDLGLLNKIYEVYLTELNPRETHYVVLDEVQLVEGWEKFARFLHETKKARVFVTGSSSKLLSSEYSTALAGRHVDMEVHPLSFREFLEFNSVFITSGLDAVAGRRKIKRLVPQYFAWGGFPKVVLTKGEIEKRDLLATYFRDIVIKDIVSRYSVKEAGKLEELAKYYLANISTLQSFNKIHKLLGLSLDTVERFSHYFSNVCLLHFIKKFSYSEKEQIVNPRKVYCVDTGMRNAVAFTFSKDLGRIAENIVFNKLRRSQREVYYWLGKNEVDFAVKGADGTLNAINVTFSDDVDERELKGLLEFKQKFKKTRKLTLITKETEKKENGVHFIPLWKWLLEE